MEDCDIESFNNTSLSEKIGADVFAKIITVILTPAYLAVLYSTSQKMFWVLFLHWIPLALLYSSHLYYEDNFLDYQCVVQE